MYHTKHVIANKLILTFLCKVKQHNAT